MLVKLSEIVEGMEFQSDQIESYLERATGRVVTISQEDMEAAEDEDSVEDCPDWQRENILIAQKILDSGNAEYLKLPSTWDIHEYEIMERFIEAIEDETISDALYHAIKGKSAFRRFKDAICDCGVREQWFKYRENAYKEIAIDWCRENQVDYKDDFQK
jgi:hypothetical protein